MSEQGESALKPVIEENNESGSYHEKDHRSFRAAADMLGSPARLEDRQARLEEERLELNEENLIMMPIDKLIRSLPILPEERKMGELILMRHEIDSVNNI